MKVKSRRQIELEQLMFARRPIKKLTHKQLADCVVECSRFYGWHTVKNLLSWYRAKKKDSLGGHTRTVPVKSRIGKVGHSTRELKDYYESDYAPGTNKRAKSLTVEMLMQVDYETLRWVAKNLGKAHAESRYGSPQFKYGQGAFGNVIDDPNPEDDIPAPTIGNPGNKRKVRAIVPPNKRQIKSWLKQSRKNRRLRPMQNKPARDVVKRQEPRTSNRAIKWITHLRKVQEFVANTRGEFNRITDEATKRLLRERKKKSFGTLESSNKGVLIRVN